MKAVVLALCLAFANDSFSLEKPHPNEGETSSYLARLSTGELLGAQYSYRQGKVAFLVMSRSHGRRDFKVPSQFDSELGYTISIDGIGKLQVADLTGQIIEVDGHSLRAIKLNISEDVFKKYIRSPRSDFGLDDLLKFVEGQ